VGAAAATLMPLVETIRTHVFAAERIHAGDTKVPTADAYAGSMGSTWPTASRDR
jgi:transposase